MQRLSSLMGVIVAVACQAMAVVHADPPEPGTMVISFPDGRRVVRPSISVTRLYDRTIRSMPAPSPAIASADGVLPALDPIWAPPTSRGIMRSRVVARTPRPAGVSDASGTPGSRPLMLLSGGPEGESEGDRETRLGDGWGPGDEEDHQNRGDEEGDQGNGDDEGDQGAGDEGGDTEEPQGSEIPTLETLEPGDGWDGPTAQPARIGNDEIFGFDQQAMARWDVVPYQRFDGTFEIGVVAFHVSGISRVEFSVEDGPWVPVSQMTTNPRTGVDEYTVVLDASRFDGDGQVEIRAIAYPVAGEPRVLAGEMTDASMNLGEFSMLLFANAGGSLTGESVYVSATGSDVSGDGSREDPYATIVKALYSLTEVARGTGSIRNVDGATVYLEEGDYVWGANTADFVRADSHWVTIRPAPGADRQDTRIVARGDVHGLRFSRIHLQNLTIRPDVDGVIESITSTGNNRTIWLDGCELVGVMPESRFVGGFTMGNFATDSTITLGRNGFRGFDLVRDCLMQFIGEDGVSDTRMVVNSSLDQVVPFEGGHPDAAAYFPTENVILYGYRATRLTNSQGLFMGNIQDMAVVDCRFDNQTGIAAHVGICFHLHGETVHMLVDNSEFVGPAHFRVDMTFSARDFLIRDTIFSTESGRPDPGIVTGVYYENTPPE